ncbi:MAG: plasmid replication protein RepC [Pseudomonadota bacterium]
MIEHAQRHVGQAGACASAGPARIDKWSLMDALTQGATRFGIGHRQIGVLRALISFHPQRFWPVTADNLIVYPSNRTLSSRLGGMPDSTLRRHLSALVAAGLITRRSSSNGKRYRRGRGADEIAFGLDLAPLVRLSAAIKQAAKAAQEQTEKVAAHRARLLSLLHDLRDSGDSAHATFLDDLGRALRRKLGLDDIANLIRATTQRLSAVLKTHTPQTKKMSGSDMQNERHIEQQEKKIKEPSITLQDLNGLCTEKASLFPEPMRQWSDVTRLGAVIAPMIGIDQKTLDSAQRRAGAIPAALMVLYILEVLPSVNAPGAFLRHLISRKDGVSQAMNDLRMRKLPADNSQSTCFSIA